MRLKRSRIIRLRQRGVVNETFNKEKYKEMYAIRHLTDKYNNSNERNIISEKNMDLTSRELFHSKTLRLGLNIFAFDLHYEKCDHFNQDFYHLDQFDFILQV